MIDHDSRPDSRLEFEAHLSASAIGCLSLVSLRASPIRVTHAQHHIARAADELLVCRQLSGSLRIEHSGLDVILQPGDMTLLDPHRPYSGYLASDSSLLVMKVPRRSLVARVGHTGDIIGHQIRATPGLGGLTSKFLCLLAEHADNLGPNAGAVADQALDLLAATVSEKLGASQPRLSCARVMVLTQLRGIIEQRLMEPDLTPQLVAAAAGVSVRYANSVLAAEDTSLARLIQARRLERCRQALADPAQSQRPISDIAHRWGFSDMTHFARRFRQTFGVLPSEYRVRQPARA